MPAGSGSISRSGHSIAGSAASTAPGHSSGTIIGVSSAAKTWFAAAIAGPDIEVGEGDPPAEPAVRRREGLAHVAEDQHLGRRHAIGVRRNLTLADIDRPVRKQRAQMVVGPAIAKPQLEHEAVDVADQ